MLSIRGIDAFYGPVQALYGLTLEVNKQEVVTLLGRNGMGKSTTIRSIFGMVSVARGEIKFKDVDIVRSPTYQIARMGIGLVPEGRQIFANLTVEENLIAMASNRLSHENEWTLRRVLELFPRLASKTSSMGFQLSGGEQQLLAIGRALMTNPSLLILDEATEGLSPLMQQEVWRCLEGLKRNGQAILIVDKNLEQLVEIADRHYVIEKGSIVWQGDSGALKSDVSVQTRYLAL